MELKNDVDITKSRQDLIQALQKIWRKFEDDMIQDLYESLPKRIKTVKSQNEL